MRTEPLARSYDPQTSHDAARYAEAKRGEYVERLAGFITGKPYKTRGELCQLMQEMGMSYAAISTLDKRFTDAERSGAIRGVGKRKCEISGRTAQTWVAM